MPYSSRDSNSSESSGSTSSSLTCLSSTREMLGTEHYLTLWDINKSLLWLLQKCTLWCFSLETPFLSLKRSTRALGQEHPAYHSSEGIDTGQSSSQPCPCYTSPVAIDRMLATAADEPKDGLSYPNSSLLDV